MQSINGILATWEPSPPPLGSIKAEIEVLTLPIRGDKSTIKAVAKFLFLNNEETKVSWCSITRQTDREVWAVVDNGFLIFTNARLLLYSQDNGGWATTGDLRYLTAVETTGKMPSVLLYTADNIVEVALHLPRVSAAASMASVDFGDRSNYAAKFDKEKLDARGRDSLSLIVGFLNEACLNARAVGQD